MRLAVALAEKSKDFDPIHLRHYQIKKNQGRFRADAVEEFFRIPGHIALQVHRFSQGRDDFADDSIIVNQQYPVSHWHSFSRQCG